MRKLRGGRAALAVPRAVGGAGDMAGDSGQARLARARWRRTHVGWSIGHERGRDLVCHVCLRPPLHGVTPHDSTGDRCLCVSWCVLQSWQFYVIVSREREQAIKSKSSSTLHVITHLSRRDVLVMYFMNFFFARKCRHES